ncbi:MAG: CbtB domain-containing protein [Pseudomonadota bacterium]
MSFLLQKFYVFFSLKNQALLSFMLIFFVLFLGVIMIALAGHAQAHILHEAAHDVRHMMGFPCH